MDIGPFDEKFARRLQEEIDEDLARRLQDEMDENFAKELQAEIDLSNAIELGIELETPIPPVDYFNNVIINKFKCYLKQEVSFLINLNKNKTFDIDP
jgi:hypothetical protein